MSIITKWKKDSYTLDHGDTHDNDASNHHRSARERPSKPSMALTDHPPYVCLISVQRPLLTEAVQNEVFFGYYRRRTFCILHCLSDRNRQLVLFDDSQITLPRAFFILTNKFPFGKADQLFSASVIR